VEGEEPFWLSERFACVDCGISLPPIEPRMFSFNGPHGACPACDGLGARVVVDPERVIGDPKRTLREGEVLAWVRRASVGLSTELSRAVAALGVDPDTAWSKLPDETKQAILFGVAKSGSKTAKKKAYEGIVPRLEARLAQDGAEMEGNDDDPDASEGGVGDD